MLVTQMKPDKELLDILPDKLFVIYCLGCSEVFFPLAEAREFAQRLKQEGITVIGEEMADYLCNPEFTGKRLELYAPGLENADAILVFSCGVGVQTLADLTDKPVYTGCDTLNVPGFAGLRPDTLDCRRCGECILGLTGGICPVANCAKGLVNGPCGGAKNGKCEIDKDKDCIWLLIWERLKKQGRLEDLRKIKSFRDYSKSEK